MSDMVNGHVLVSTAPSYIDIVVKSLPHIVGDF